MSAKLWRLALAVWLAGCAGPAPSLRDGHGESPALEAVPYDDAPEEDASAPAAASGKVVLAQAVVEEPVEEDREEQLGGDSSAGPGHTGPVFVIPWGQAPSTEAGPPPTPSPSAAGGETVPSVALDAATKARIDKALAECADMASTLVLGRRTKGRRPTPKECLEEVGRDAKGKPMTHAQQLGIEMHQVALECARDKLGKLRPGGFGIDQRYRYDPQKGRTTPVSPEEEEDLLHRGRGSELLGTIVPDVVIHAGNPAKVQAVYDFKFPCVDPDELPAWRMYPDGHPYQGEPQGKIYEKALGVKPARVTPRRGVIP